MMLFDNFFIKPLEELEIGGLVIGTLLLYFKI